MIIYLLHIIKKGGFYYEISGNRWRCDRRKHCCLSYKSRKEVTLIARGRQLEEISEYGLFVSKGRNEFNAKINTVSAEEYDDNPDVIFLCVKGYSLESTYPIIKSCAVKNTVIIPLLNGYGINEKYPKNFLI